MCPICGTAKIVCNVNGKAHYSCGYRSENDIVVGHCHSTAAVPQKDSSKCLCDVMLLMSKGCQCGQIQKEKQNG